MFGFAPAHARARADICLSAAFITRADVLAGWIVREALGGTGGDSEVGSAGWQATQHRTQPYTTASATTTTRRMLEPAASERVVERYILFYLDPG